MAKSADRLLHGDVTSQIIRVYHQAHYEFGCGFLERLCQRVMVIALTDAGLTVAEGLRFDVQFRGRGSVRNFVCGRLISSSP